MTILTHTPHFHSTASNGFAADTLPGDLCELGDHLGTCQNSHRHLLTLRCAAVSARGFIATRLVTTVMVGVAFAGLYVWLV
ncbi:hypothetical protein [Rhodoferax antarcticus]|uniref:hypothetical protein n=1 Tax=Rhodoferax antarcticus TaxID=81479 RepID=UPI000B2E68B3|nr:hypothetical protein [Rhodoferax antarcticus]MCW2311648.1 hypothetical protein [Rhodoferax antarcticus]